MKGWAIDSLRVAFIGILSIFASATLAQETTPNPPVYVYGPPPFFPPAPPPLDSDDTSIDYHYKVLATGWAGYGDPEGDASGLVAGAEESIVHHKTNNTTTASSHSIGYFGSVLVGYCACNGTPGCTQILLVNGTTTCTNSDDTSCTAWTDCLAFTAALGVTECQQPGWYQAEEDITSGPTTNTIACGTTVTGRSAYEHFRPLGDNSGHSGGACGLVPAVFMAGCGSLFQTDLTITTDCPPPSASSFNFAFNPSGSRRSDLGDSALSFGPWFSLTSFSPNFMKMGGGSTPTEHSSFPLVP